MVVGLGRRRVHRTPKSARTGAGALNWMAMFADAGVFCSRLPLRPRGLGSLSARRQRRDGLEQSLP